MICDPWDVQLLLGDAAVQLPVVDAPPLEALKAQLDGAVSNLF